VPRFRPSRPAPSFPAAPQPLSAGLIGISDHPVLTILIAILVASVIGAAAWLYTPDKPREALEAAYAPPPSQFLLVAGVRLHVRDTGPRDAPAVIMLHGFGASLHTWEDWAQGLADHYRVIRFDLPGFGLSGPDPSDDYSDARSLRLITGLMDQLGVARAAMVGNSMGGKLAWLLAAEQPERVTKLILIAPDGFASPGFEYGKKAEVPMVARLLPYTLPKIMVKMNLAPAYANPNFLTDRLLTRYRDLMLAPGSRQVLLERMAQIDLQEPAPLLAQITAPTLLLWGEQDRMIPISNAQDYLKDIKGSRLISFKTLGHLPQEEAPAESLAPLRAFLEQ
jgi:pimeloyl-ACP methyl ester carboxylesterase